MIAPWWAAAVLVFQSISPHPEVGILSVGGSRHGMAPEKIGAEIGASEELGPQITAQSAVAVDVASGAVLFGKRPQAMRPLASLTKLVTALTFVRLPLTWERDVEIIAADIPADGGTVLVTGDRVTVHELFALLLVGSDNAAGRALARVARGGDGMMFVEDMRAVVRALGTPSISITEPTGLDPENVGSATDIATVIAAAVDDPTIVAQMLRSEVTIDPHRTDGHTIRVRATNSLIRDGVRHAFMIRGGKTGYLDEAGSNLALIVERGGHRVAVVVLGSATRDDRFRDARVLADWVYRHYRWPTAAPEHALP